MDAEQLERLTPTQRRQLDDAVAAVAAAWSELRDACAAFGRELERALAAIAVDVGWQLEREPLLARLGEELQRLEDARYGGPPWAPYQASRRGAGRHFKLSDQVPRRRPAARARSLPGSQ